MLVHAGFELLGGAGVPSLTVRGVCRRTELNPRYFYESFDTVDDLVLAVYDQVVQELAAVVGEALATAAPTGGAAALRVAIDQTVGFVDEDRRRGRVLYVEALGNEALNRRRIENEHGLVALIERDAASRRRGSTGDDPIGVISAAILVGGFTELLAAWLDGRMPVTREQLVDDTTALFVGLGDVAATIAAGRSRRPAGAGMAAR
jgi:AcrR family transcriptional regulator